MPSTRRPVAPERVRHRNPLSLLVFVAVGLGAVIAVLLPTISWSSVAEVPGTFTIEGTVEVPRCNSKEFADGSQVTILTRDGTILGNGLLIPSEARTDPVGAFPCEYSFSVKGVPTGLPQYGVHAGNTARGVTWKNETEARAGFALSIG